MHAVTHRRDEAKAYARENLRGAISAICLPITADGQVDEAGLRHDIRHCLDVIGVGGLYLHGFYGHFWLLDVPTRQRVIEIAVDEIAGAVPVICRCWSPSLSDTILLAQHAERSGADIISVLGPWLGAGSDDMVFRWFEQIAASTSLGLSVFNSAQLGYELSPEILARVSEIPNVAALKNHVAPAQTSRLRAMVGDSIVVIDPDEETLLHSMLEHGQRAIYSGTNYMFDTAGDSPMHDYIEAALAGDAGLATARYEAMQPLRDLHHQWVIEPWVRDGRCPVSIVKRWSQAMGMVGGRVPAPLDELPPEDIERLWADIADARQLSQDRTSRLVRS